MVVGDTVLAAAVLRFHEEQPRAERGPRPRAVLGGDLRARLGADAAVGIQAEGLFGFADQSFVGVQVEGAPGLCQGVSALVPVLLFPDPPVEGGVAAAGEKLLGSEGPHGDSSATPP